MTLQERLRGYNPPDRTIDSQRQIAVDIHEAADALDAKDARIKELEGDCSVWIDAAMEARERARRAEALAESYRKALDNIEIGLRKAGASLPAPEITGTIEGSMNTGLCIALCLVVTEREALK